MIKDLDHDVQIRMQTYSNPKVRNLAIHDIPAPDEKEDLRSCPVAPCFLGNPFFASKLLCTTVINVTNLPSAMLKQAHIQKKIINTISIHTFDGQQKSSIPYPSISIHTFDGHLFMP